MKPRVIQIGRLQTSLRSSARREFDTRSRLGEADATAFLAREAGNLSACDSARFGPTPS